jgi:hypothetical protein
MYCLVTLYYGFLLTVRFQGATYMQFFLDRSQIAVYDLIVSNINISASIYPPTPAPFNENH